MIAKLIGWLIYVAIAVAIWASVLFAWHHFVIVPAEARGAAQQAATDGLVIAGLTKERDQAVAANKAMSASLDTLQGQLGQLDRTLDAAAAAARLATAHAAAALVAATLRSREDAAQITALKNIVAAEDHETMEAACADARALLADLATWRRGLLH